MNRIYMDNAATTPVDARVLRAMMPYFSARFGNASSLHSFGREAAEALEEGREKVAKALGADAAEVCFTSGGTEADNLAIKGAALANRGKGNHIITSAIEHPAVLQTCKFLEGAGFEVTYIPVDKCGLVDVGALERAITKKTSLVSIMHANNEIGTIEPITEIGKICSARGVLFHTDAVQTFGKIATNVKRLNVDLLSMSSHKIYGPKGVGALFIREGTAIEPLMHGGGHERNVRAGTENVAGLVGFGEATAICRREMAKEATRETTLRDRLVKGILSEIKGSILNGHPKKRLPGNANISFAGIEGESLIMHLDMKGVAASTGSACSSKSLKASHVLLACGLKELEAHGSLRITLGRENTKADISHVLKVLPPIAEWLRKISPIAR